MRILFHQTEVPHDLPAKPISQCVKLLELMAVSLHTTEEQYGQDRTAQGAGMSFLASPLAQWRLTMDIALAAFQFAFSGMSSHHETVDTILLLL